MSNLSNISITHTFNGDTAASNLVNAADLDTQLGNLATTQNLTKAALDTITDGNNDLAAQTVGLAQLKPEVIVAIETGSGGGGGGGDLLAANNLSDLDDAATARTNLGLGSAATAAASSFLQVTNNLSDVNSASTARTNLGLGTAATAASSSFLQVTNNLSDLGNAGTARTNLGLGTAALLASSAVLQSANNLSDVANAGTARTNLGLGSAALLASSAVAQTANNLSDLANAGTARTNLGLGSAALLASSAVLQSANNLSDVANAATARTNLGITSSTLVGAWTDAGPIPLTATTTPPTKGTTSADKCIWRRVGGGMDIKFTYIQTAIGSAAAGSGTYLLTIPDGQSIDTSLITATTDVSSTLAAVNATHLGFGYFHNSSAGTYNTFHVFAYDATRLKIAIISGSTLTYWASGSNALNVSGMVFVVSLQNIPIAGW